MEIGLRISLSSAFSFRNFRHIDYHPPMRDLRTLSRALIAFLALSVFQLPAQEHQPLAQPPAKPGLHSLWKVQGTSNVVYLLGTLAVAFHLANGLQTFCMGWGLASSREGLRRLEKYVILAFVLLLAMSWGAIYALWAAGAAAPS